MRLEEARDLAARLFMQHSLADWRFDFDRARRRLGACWYERKLITLSREFVLLNEVTTVTDVLLHEIAHALTPGDGHGPGFKAVASRLGCTTSACLPDTALKTTPAPYRLQCPHCGRSWSRYRRPSRRLFCSSCWEARQAPVQPLNVSRAA